MIIPKQMQPRVMALLHESHPGMLKMKMLARGHVWWDGMNQQLEEFVRCCLKCQQEQKEPARAPLHPWEYPSDPWQRVHIDFAGPVRGHMILIIVDAHTKWIEAVPMKNATAEATVRSLRNVFATFGLPTTVVSDNGTSFTSSTFQDFV